MENIVELKSLHFSYGVKNILKDISLTCLTGDVLGIFGRNGSGKSTLLRLIFGTLKPQSGEIFLNNKPINKKITLNVHIAYHHEDIFLPKDITVRNLIPLYFPKGSDQNNIFYDSRIAKIERQRVGTLSIGEQKYLQFLLIINLNRDFVLLDEPFTMVEPLYINAIKEKINEHKSRKGFIITDHYYLDVLDIATKKMVIKDRVITGILRNDELTELDYLKQKRGPRI